MDGQVFGRILVIDDEVGILHTLKSVLRGNEAVTAASGVNKPFDVQDLIMQVSELIAEFRKDPSPHRPDGCPL